MHPVDARVRLAPADDLAEHALGVAQGCHVQERRADDFVLARGEHKVGNGGAGAVGGLALFNV